VQRFRLGRARPERRLLVYVRRGLGEVAHAQRLQDGAQLLRVPVDGRSTQPQRRAGVGAGDARGHGAPGPRLPHLVGFVDHHRREGPVEQPVTLGAAVRETAAQAARRVLHQHGRILPPAAEECAPQSLQRRQHEVGAGRAGRAGAAHRGAALGQAELLQLPPPGAVVRPQGRHYEGEHAGARLGGEELQRRARLACAAGMGNEETALAGRCGERALLVLPEVARHGAGAVRMQKPSLSRARAAEMSRVALRAKGGPNKAWGRQSLASSCSSSLSA